MQTARDRAILYVEGWGAALGENLKRTLTDRFEAALKEQDKLTRHAIAEKLLEVVETVKIKGEGFVDVIEASRAENIAMNTRAV